MTRFWRSAYAMAAAMVVVLLGSVAACSGSGDNEQPDASVAATPAGHPRTTQGSTANEVAVPELEDGTTSLLEVGPANGYFSAGIVEVEAGIWWASVNCLGEGAAILTVELDPVVTFEVPCTAGEGQTTNQFDDEEPYRVDVTVDAPDDVRWAIVIHQ